jgi:tetratricopeptide (TPR) repeat protein
MKVAWNILLLALPIILLPLVARSQASSLRNDPVFQAARKAQQEGRIADAEKILNDRIHAIEGTQPNSPVLVPYLMMLGSFHSMKQQFPEALAIYERVLEIDRTAYGPSDYRSLRDLINVASFLGPDKKDQIEQLYKQALDLARQNPKTPPGTAAEILASFARFYEVEQRWYDAQPLAEQGMKICNSVALPPGLGGPCEPLQRTLTDIYNHEGRTVEGERVAASGMESDLPPELDALEKSAQQSEKDGLYPDAEFKYRQAAAYIEAHPEWDGGKMPANLMGLLVGEYTRLGNVLEKEGRNDLAEEAYRKAIASMERKSPNGQVTLQSFSFLGLRDLYRREKRLDELEPIIAHALELQEKTVGDSSDKVAQTLLMFGDLYKDENKYAQAEPLLERAMKIYETNLGLYDRQELSLLRSYADLLHKLSEDPKAAEIDARIKKIEKQQADLNRH